MDVQTAQVAIAALGVANTIVLAYVAIRTNQVHGLANGARAAAVEAAHVAGVVHGLTVRARMPDGASGPSPESTG